jgi:hypothetical protein
MHLHLPKPLHGWREFFGEVGIIVIGVLIAIGAEQIVETTHVRHQSEGALQAVRVQLSYAAGVYEERTLVQPCLDRRLEEMDALLKRIRVAGKLPDVGELGRAPVRPVPVSAWSTASQSGLVMQFAPQDRDELSNFYAQSVEYPRQVEEEDEMWSVMNMLTHAPGPIDGALLADATTTLQRLKFRDWLNGINATQLLSSIRELGVQPNYSIVTNDGERAGRDGLLERVRERPVCKPLLIDAKAYLLPS